MLKVGFVLRLFLAVGHASETQESEYNQILSIQLGQTITQYQGKITERLEKQANLNFQSCQLIEAMEGIKCAKLFLEKHQHFLSLGRDQAKIIDTPFLSIPERKLRIELLNSYLQNFELDILNFKPFETAPYKDIAILDLDTPGFQYTIRNLKKHTQDQDQVIVMVNFPSLRPIVQTLKRITQLNQNEKEKEKNEGPINEAISNLTNYREDLTLESSTVEGYLRKNALEVSVLSAEIAIHAKRQKEHLDELIKLTSEE